MPEYVNQTSNLNNDSLYKQVMKDRGVLSIQQFRTKYFKNVDLSKYSTTKYIWKKGDNLFKIANLFYRNRKYWWLIGYFNQKPTDGHYEIGEEILIPTVSIINDL